MNISLLHPSRQRPVKSFNAAHNWLSNVKDKRNVEYILSIDEDDPTLNEYRLFWDDLSLPNGKLVVRDNRSLIDAANAAAEASSGNLIVLMSDDFESFANWDEILLKELEGKRDYIVKVSDTIQDWIITLPIMDRFYFERFEYIYHPEFLHMYSDTEMTHVADLLGKTIHLPHLVFEHKHPSKGQVQKDALNIRNDSTYQSGEAIYLNHVRNNFGLSPDEIKGKVSSQSHVEWLQKKGVRV